ncbi:MAG TPA: beta-galactosidase, partial [Actinopolymorphaceae bacterium]
MWTVTTGYPITRKQILLDGRPRLAMSGEVHYFRLRREEWADRLDKLVEAGCNTVASYIPWLWHELPDGTLDLTGRSRPERDLGTFVDLCADRGLLFVARPGPFVMAELKNEGLPYRLYDEHPEIVPITWDGRPVPTRTVDYLSPAFLAESERWLAAVVQVLAPRLSTVLAIQLDNEVGMLSWVSRSPDLTDHVLADLVGYLTRRYDPATLAERYPFRLDSPDEAFPRFRSPEERYALALMRDLGHYMRDRFARYLRTLRDFCEKHLAAYGDYTAGTMPYLVNVHGTSDGRGTTFPIGISQLAQSYSGVPGMVGGSDHYLGDLTTRNAIDLYLINAFLDAVNDDDQPLTSIEFEAGDGDYGQDLTHVHDPSTIDLKTRLCIAQGNRLVNYYLFTGGVNPPLDTPVGDGNDRIAFTGERHGTGAPVGPEGQYGLTYARTADVVRATLAIERTLATMTEEHDPLRMAYVPDYFMTESVYPSSRAMAELVDDLEWHRFGGPQQLFARALLLGGYRFGAVDLQRVDPTPEQIPVLALASARHLDATLQDRLVRYLRRGGRLLLCGEVPTYDMEGRPCTALMDALGLRLLGKKHGDHRYFLSVEALGWAAPRPEVRVGHAQLFATEGLTDAVILREVDGGAGC